MKDLEKELGQVEEGPDGLPSARWEARSLSFIRPPFPLRVAWRPHVVLRRVRVHRRALPSLSKALECLRDQVGVEALRAAGLDLFGGCYLPGDMQGGVRTAHGYGCAFRLSPSPELAPESLGSGRRGRKAEAGTLAAVLDLMAANGWVVAPASARTEGLEFVFTGL